jgi:hypothetical protein
MDILRYRLVSLRPLNIITHLSFTTQRGRFLDIALTHRVILAPLARSVYYNENIFILSRTLNRPGQVSFMYPNPRIGHQVRRIEVKLKVDIKYLKDKVWNLDYDWRFLLRCKGNTVPKVINGTCYGTKNHRKTLVQRSCNWQEHFPTLKTLKLIFYDTKESLQNSESGNAVRMTSENKAVVKSKTSEWTKLSILPGKILIGAKEIIVEVVGHDDDVYTNLEARQGEKSQQPIPCPQTCRDVIMDAILEKMSVKEETKKTKGHC